LTEGDVVAIRKGVANGDSVVIDGVDKLQPGSKVAPTANESATRAGNAAPAPAPSAAKAGRGRKATS
jgi:multidrug efflux system membrane fusion protein